MNLPGQPVIPGYAIQREIGRGSTSVVFRAAREDRPFAVKVLQHRANTGSDQTVRFRREAAALARLTHPGVVSVVEAGESEDQSYLVMELVEGQDLAEVLRSGPLPEAALEPAARTLAGALREVHRRGLVHRDIKPANILMERGQAPKLIDFGLAADTTRSGDGQELVGTVQYAAPEQTGMIKRPVDARSDLYSLGAVLFECAAGRPPFQGSNAAALIHQHATVPAPELKSLHPGIRPSLSAIVGKLLAKDPDDRYQTAQALVADLERLDAIDAQLAEGHPVELGTARQAYVFEVPLVGRDRELSTLQRLWNEAAMGRGGVVLVEGEPGSGKTRMVRELLAREAESGALVLTCKSTHHEQVPFGPLREALDAHVLRLFRAPASERERGLELLRKAAGEMAPLLRRLSRGLERALEGAASRALEAASDQERFYGVVAQLFAALAREAGGAILVVDDVQWLDDASRQVVRRLVAQSGGTPLLVICGARSDAQSAPAVETFAKLLGTAVEGRRLKLSALDEIATGLLVAAQLGGTPPEGDFVGKLSSRTRGNPFAVGEYLRAMLDSGALRPTLAGWTVDEGRLSSVALPSDVLELVTSRIATLSNDARTLLGAAAVVGHLWDAGLVRTLTGMTEARAGSVIQECLQATLIEASESSQVGEVYAFVHDRVAEAVLHPMPEQRRRALHQQIAETLDRSGADLASNLAPELVFQIARHYLRGDPAKAPERVRDTCLAAGKLALASFANADAHELLDRALAAARSLGQEGSATAGVRELLGQACTRLARIPEALSHFQEALAHVTDPLVRGRIHAQLARVNMALWRPPGVGQHCEAALEALGRPLDKTAAPKRWERALVLGPPVEAPPLEIARRELLASIYGMWGFMAWSASTPRLIALVAPELRAVLEQLGARREAVDGLAMYAFFLGALREPAGFGAGEQAVQLAQQFGDRALEASAMRHLGWAAQLLGDFKRHEQIQRQGLARLGNWMHPRDYVAICNEFGLALTIRGQTQEAAEVARQGLAKADGSGLPSGMTNIRATCASVEALCGRMVPASELLRQALEIKAKRVSANDVWTTNWVFQHRLFVLLEEGELGAEVEEAIADFEALGVAPEDVPSVMQHGFVCLAHIRAQQLARAPAEERPEAGRRLAAAMATLENIAQDPIKRAHLEILRVATERVIGETSPPTPGDAESDRARTALSRLQRAEADALTAGDLWSLFLTKLERARTLRRSEPAVAAMDARAARDLATAQGWARRARAVEQEFKLGNAAALGATIGATIAAEAGTTLARGAPVGRDQRYLDALLQVSLASGSAIDATEQARATLDAIVQVFGAERAFLFDAAPNGTLTLKLGRDAAHRDLHTAQGYSTTVVHQVASSRRPAVVTGTDEGALIGSASAVAHDLRSIMAAPLTVRERLVGVVYLDSRLARGLFTASDLDVLQAISNHIAIAAETARMARGELERLQLQHELALSGAVQSMFLPPSHAKLRGLELAGFYRSATTCGGDWWWYDVAPDGAAAVVVGDVTGHGPAPAILTASVATSVRLHRKEHPEWSLERMFIELNRDFEALCHGSYLMTVFGAELAADRRSATLVSGGGPSAWVVKPDGSTASYPLQASPLGGDPFTVGSRTIGLERGDRLFLYTDGLSELETASGRQYGVRRLLQQVVHSRAKPVTESIAHIVAQLDAARGERPQGDDLTCALLEVVE